MKGPPELGPIVGESMAIRRARELIERYAPTSLPILLVGPTGTGKELLARHIHARSGRRGRFVGVNCGALPREMAEGLLFGYERGAFSGAVKRHRGHLECADGGTLFLDELLSLPVDGQAKLLRALDTGEIQRLGEELERYVDLRVVGAVQEDVTDEICRGTLRRDLYERLAGIVIEVPPLANRSEDVAPLARYFASERGQVLEPGTPRVLAAHSWPGNVRELRLAIDRAGNAAETGTIPAWALAEAIAMRARPYRAQEDAAKSAPVLHDLQRQELVATLEDTDWDTAAAARVMGVHRATVYRRMTRAGVPRRGGVGSRGFASVRANSHAHNANDANGVAPVESQPQI
jgi:two-component system response regulator HydG